MAYKNKADLHAYQANWHREFRQKNPEAIQAYDREYYAKNAEKKREQKRAARAANPELHKASLRKSYQKLKAKRYAENLAWRRANPESYSLLIRKAKAKRRGAEGSFIKNDILDLLKRQNSRCIACDRAFGASLSYTIDHIQPLVRGGSNWPKNLQLMCLRCNQIKGAKWKA